MSDELFDDGTTSGYAELPVSAAWLTWTRGDAKLAAIKDADPGLYFGGWKAFVKNPEGEPNPELPLPIVERTSEDGKHKYQVYASNYVVFLPIVFRLRHELRQRVKDPETGREYDKVVAVSKNKQPNYAPNRQIFGVVYSLDGKKTGYAVLKINKWSSFISFEKAGQAWKKIKSPEGKALVRRYGTAGDKDGSPVFETFGQSRSTPIDAIGLSKAVFVDITPELREIGEKSLAWKNCSAWNAEGETNEQAIKSLKDKFVAMANEIGLTNIDIEQILAENGNDYAKATRALGGADVNDKLSEGDNFE